MLPWTLCLVSLLSGAAALTFETLWFRFAGLALGNSSWASSLVLASFMGGLALGNGLAARYGARVRNPVRAYAWLESAVGVSGLGLVVLFPMLSQALSPIFTTLLDRPLLLNGLRFALAFGVLLIPTTAMGATLPLLVRALSSRETQFGHVLGRIYGWNTLGAVAGALVGELVLIERLGLRGTGAAAALACAIASGTAFLLSRRLVASPLALDTPRRPMARMTPTALRYLSAAWLSGAILLALEVIWFRFLLLFVMATSLAFAVMLGVVLLGISAGGLTASWWLRRRAAGPAVIPLISLTSAVFIVTSYAALSSAMGPAYALVSSAWAIAAKMLPLMFPVCALSGALFTLLGSALKETVGEESRTTGALALANTVGGMCGALAGGLVLLPVLGMERSFFVLALAYSGVALCAMPWDALRTQRLLPYAGLAFVLVLALFPFGMMANHVFPTIARRFGGDALKVAVVRESPSETVIYLRRELWGAAHHFVLITNGYAMSGSSLSARRYMKQFVYLPLALRPESKRALLICYGVGSTARALTDSSGLTSIDIVDISKAILDLSSVVYPSPSNNPTRDPRVRLHVEDGRFFLQTTPQRFDLITAEPPPPRNAGVVNLYSQEYFEAMRGRLTEGGIATYWLPVPQLTPTESKAIIKAFCNAFPDCSMWTGVPLSWMLMGSRGGIAPVSEQDFGRQWRDPVVAPELRAVGFDTPEMLASTFLADAPFLRALTEEQAALVDDYPLRLGAGASPTSAATFYDTIEDPDAAARRFHESQYLDQIWPWANRASAAAAFESQGILWRHFSPRNPRTRTAFGDLYRLLTMPGSSQAIALWLLESDSDELRLARDARARGMKDTGLLYELAIGALTEGRHVEAEDLLGQVQALDPVGGASLTELRIVSACLAGNKRRAMELRWPDDRTADREFWRWLHENCAPPVLPS